MGAARGQWPESCRIGGLRVDNVQEADVIGRIASLVEMPGFQRVVTPNVDHVVTAQHDETFRSAVNSAALSLPDGQWLRRGARLMGLRLYRGAVGRKLVDPLCALSARRGWSVYILASRGGTAARAAEVLQARHSGLRVVGARSPSPEFSHDAAETEHILAELDAVRPDVLFLGLGAPKSEKWMLRHADRIPARVGLSLGYAFDVIAGNLPECPMWMTRCGVECIFRLLHEPRRLWRRYLLHGPYFFYLILK